jgi:hypothetical protein
MGWLRMGRATGLNLKGRTWIEITAPAVADYPPLAQRRSFFDRLMENDAANPKFRYLGHETKISASILRRPRTVSFSQSPILERDNFWGHGRAVSRFRLQKNGESKVAYVRQVNCQFADSAVLVLFGRLR